MKLPVRQVDLDRFLFISYKQIEEFQNSWSRASDDFEKSRALIMSLKIIQFSVWETKFLEHSPENRDPLYDLQNSTCPDQFSTRPGQKALALASVSFPHWF